MSQAQQVPATARAGGVLEVFAAFLKLGLTSFGGPVAHLGYFRHEFVERRRWLDEATYGDIVALCQFLPGPASSQTGLMIGLSRAGYGGAAAAWLGFTAPSALLMILFAFEAPALTRIVGAGWLHGLRLAAVAVVAQAVLAMSRTLTPDRARATIAVAAAIAALWVATPLVQLAVIAAGLAVGFAFLRGAPDEARPELPVIVGRRAGGLALVLFGVLLFGLPALAAASGDHGLDLFARFYRVGSLVFGGGHVVLPLLQAEVVAPGWVSRDAFLAGYGAAQAVPGPLFTFAAYLGAVMGPSPNGWTGAVICLAAIFLPSFFLIVGVLPFWNALRRRPEAQGALMGANAAVVGLLAAALYNPVWTSAVTRPFDVGLVIAAFLLLTAWRVPPWAVVVLSAAAAAWTG
ncbi:MAG: chromate efflux transporter [Caulobacterales bacterium]